MRKTTRSGYSLVEIVVALGVLAVLIGLLLPGVAKVREAGARSQNMNNIRQIGVATHTFADTHGGALPSATGGGPPFHDFVLSALSPTLAPAAFRMATDVSLVHVKCFVSPADPTWRLDGATPFLASYAANAQLFKGDPRLPQSVPDGTSVTLAFAEHYALCPQTTQFSWIMTNYLPAGPRRATFADGGAGLGVKKVEGAPPEYELLFQDAHPVPGGGGQTLGSMGDLTFQVRPAPDEADPRLAQTPHAGGMIVGMADGSVRSVSPGVSPPAYWAAVTPAAGDVAGNW